MLEVNQKYLVVKSFNGVYPDEVMKIADVSTIDPESHRFTCEFFRDGSFHRCLYMPSAMLMGLIHNGSLTLINQHDFLSGRELQMKRFYCGVSPIVAAEFVQIPFEKYSKIELGLAPVTHYVADRIETLVENHDRIVNKYLKAFNNPENNGPIYFNYYSDFESFSERYRGTMAGYEVYKAAVIKLYARGIIKFIK